MANPLTAADIGYTPFDPDSSSSSQKPLTAADIGYTEYGKTPTPEPEPDYAHMGWGDVGLRALKAAPQGAANAWEGLWNSITNPIETAKVASSAIQGGVAKLPSVENFFPAFEDASSQIGMPATYPRTINSPGISPAPLPVTDEEKYNEKMFNVAAQPYIDRYGPLLNGDTSGIKKSLATNPFDIGMDASLLAPVVGAPLRAAGLASEAGGIAGTIAKAGNIAQKVIDPIQGPLSVASSVAGGTGKLSNYLLRNTQGVMGDVPPPLLKKIQDIYASGDGEAIDKFKQFANGTGDYNEIATTLLDAANAQKQRASASYQSTAQGLANSTDQLPMNGIGAALQELNNEVARSGTSARYPQLQSHLQNVNQQILDTIQSTSPSARTMDDLMNLKRSIASNYDIFGNNGVGPQYNNLIKSIKDTISAKDPKYAEMLEDWSDALDLQNQYKKDLGVSNKKTATQIVTSTLKKTGSVSGQDLLSTLTSTPEGKHLEAMLAGSATSTWMPQSGALKQIVEYAPAAAATLMHPAAWPSIVGTAALASPKIAGQTQAAIGTGERLYAPLRPGISAIASTPSSYALTRDFNENYEPPIPRATGGRVGDHHERLVSRLMTLAERAKKDVNNTTEPLLNVPDATIVKALHVANQAI